MLEAAYADEERYWRQRSRIQWLQARDKISTFFHAVTRSLKTLNNFAVIEDEAGNVYWEEGRIARTIANYYRDLFTSNASSNLAVVENTIQRKISEFQNEVLLRIPDMAEIPKAVFNIHADKAPGPDGFWASFYQAYWDIIGEDVAGDIRQFFIDGSLHPRHNETHVRLIPKGKGPRKVSDYRPIALCSTQYKIIAKILTSRLQSLLPSLISAHQSAFVSGRAITDNVLITHEILHCLKASEAKQRCSMAIKTDMSKAYDRIEWNFLRKVLEGFGFHNQFVDWLMVCVSTVSYSFLINGSPQGKVIPSRGLRQGDSLSPYLFILCSEVLSSLCSQAQARGAFPGIKVVRSAPAITHLLFADDTMFFCRTDQASCHTLASILKQYEEASGQKINLLKSSITFSSKTPIEVRQRVKECLQIQNEGGVGKYLGLPEHFGRRKRDIFASIMDKIRQRSHNWSAKYLSGAGKQVLLKDVLSSMPSYAITCFKLHKSLCKQIQAIFTRFWWDAKPNIRKMSCVSWNKLTLPKSAGGLGFREIEQFNDALLAKVAWRIIKHPDSLLSQILTSKYCHSTTFMEAQVPKTTSHGWRSILAGRVVLKRGAGWIVGNGRQISVWRDPWLSTSTPLTPIGPPTAQNQNMMVADLIDPASGDWNIPAIRSHLPQYEDNIRLLVPSVLGMQDNLVWLPEKEGTTQLNPGMHWPN